MVTESGIHTPATWRLMRASTACTPSWSGRRSCGRRSRVRNCGSCFSRRVTGRMGSIAAEAAHQLGKNAHKRRRLGTEFPPARGMTAECRGCHPCPVGAPGLALPWGGRYRVPNTTMVLPDTDTRPSSSRAFSTRPAISREQPTILPSSWRVILICMPSGGSWRPAPCTGPAGCGRCARRRRRRPGPSACGW